MPTFNFVITTPDLLVKFSCANHQKRVGEIMRNLHIGPEADDQNRHKMLCHFRTSSPNASFSFNGEEAGGPNVVREAVFFENTDYPLLVRGNGKTLKRIELFIADHLRSDTDKKNTIQSDGGELYGNLNFRNQVGETELKLVYETAQGDVRSFCFSTEVLSYKLDYRSDLLSIIADVEQEYAMLSYSFLKDTYLNFRTKAGKNTELIWWQIFKSCYSGIMQAARTIIAQPKRRLRTAARYERAERLPFLPRECEAEYAAHSHSAAYLYRTEEMELSRDTVENRFLKYALSTMWHKFNTIAQHIRTAMRLSSNRQLGSDVEQMDAELRLLVHHPFFRGIGPFKGFAQDSLVMKQQRGYRTIFRLWLELQQGFDLEEGMRRLEVKDISELYEIWCFIKVKNIVADVLRGLHPQAAQKTDGKDVARDFIPQLVYGGSVSFLKEGGVELASVSYNAEVESQAARSCIAHTTTFTTTQRPDIVLRLSKERDEVQYTYLFDAKYRINDQPSPQGHDVPPEDAINQMHRYRDAIYYAEGDAPTQKEVVAGYVLFPGNIPADAFASGAYHYQQSNRRIGIGAFPLKPDLQTRNAQGELVLNPHSSEAALRDQIRAWLTDGDARTTLLRTSVPQKGLEYHSCQAASPRLLIGYAKADEFKAVRQLRYYYIRAFKKGQPAQFIEGIGKVEYLLVHGGGQRGFFAITGGPEFISGEGLRKKGFATDAADTDMYLGFDLGPADAAALGFLPEKVDLGTPTGKDFYAPKVRTLREADV